MATNAKVAPPLPANGVISAPPKGLPGGNRKKQKRRAKQAAKITPQPVGNGTPQPAEQDYEEDPLRYGDDDDDYDYSDAEGEDEQYADQYPPPHSHDNHHHHHHHHHHDHGFDMPPPPVAKRSRKKKKGSVGHGAYDPSMLPPLPNPPHPHPHPPSRALSSMHRNTHHHDDIWNTSTAQERQNIKEFWLSLSEEERKSLLKIEKEAVLRKMKQQQKHSCSCTVCGRKRTAIEEELEVLYEGYYEELEQYAHHDHPPLPSVDGLIPDPLQHHRPHPLAAPPPRPQHRTSALHEHLDEDGYSDEEDDDEEGEEYSDEDEEGYSDEDVMPEPPRAGVPDFFNFGQNLTVKGILTPWLEKLQQGLKGKADNLLTVADDLLKNDGRKFIEMMEQLAERRMQRESEAEYAAANPSHPGGYPPDPGYSHEDPLAANEEFDDDEASYDSQEDYDDDMDDESETGGLTEEQRMQEGRRMFQIFAARMFEQRVLNAYREKVSAERQAKLLEELEGEDQARANKEAKKARDAQKKKEKKKKQQQVKAEEKARKDAEKAEEEARLREAEERKLEEQRRRKDEQRRKKDEEKRKQDEERARKDAEKARRLQEDQQRREDAERKAREQRAAEKAKKDEQRKREREEREAREKEGRDRKAFEEKDRKEREAKARADEEVKKREKTAQQAAQPPSQAPQITKQPSQIGMVAIPSVHQKQTPSGVSSPHPQIAAPAIPKAPTPAKQRQASQQGSLASSPKQAPSQVSSAPSKSSSPGSIPEPQHQRGQQGPIGQPRTIMQKPSNQHMGPHHPMQTMSPLHQHPIQGPPGMPQHHQGGFGAMAPMGFPGFQGQQPPMMHGNMGHRGPVPMYQQQHGPPMGVPNRMPFSPNMNGMPGPPGMMQPPGRGMGFPFDGPGPQSGFMPNHPPSHTSPMDHPQMQQQPPNAEPPRAELPGHSRQPSASEKERFESAANQPIARPAPIQRPSSVKPLADERKGSNSDLDDLSKHLGSSALLADDDEPLPTVADNRRHSGMQSVGRNAPPVGLGALGGFGGAPQSGFGGGPGSNWNTPSLQHFGPGSAGLGPTQQWGAIPPPGMSGWAQNQSAFAANGAFGSMGSGMQPHRPTGTSLNRPLTIRLAVCQACRQLSSVGEGGDGFHPLEVLLRQIEGNRPLLDSPPTLREIEEICETEGDSQNGGGELHVRRSGSDSIPNGNGNRGFAVKWEPDAGTPADASRGPQGLGEIGSPMPAKLSPAFGAPGMGRQPQQQAFQSLGAVGSSGF
ncbi:Stress response protein nst1 [Recurvomyces mirabilis]|uniref:Stress response protein NST1 n=1 Tax=Recurvomyces mirabilis TaxID=574656 RepID=A0AAE0WJT6_9PEZI|nr:Stress response protein nst1 [Recurvomyces mirabilis]KAK5150891.1 Stress response protein nst1 [Recurvomyces mirabilis]